MGGDLPDYLLFWSIWDIYNCLLVRRWTERLLTRLETTMLSWKIVPPTRNVNFPFFSLIWDQFCKIIFQTVSWALRSPMSCSEGPSPMVSPGKFWKFSQVLPQFSSLGDTGESLRYRRDTELLNRIFKAKIASHSTYWFESHRPPPGKIPGKCWAWWTVRNVRSGPGNCQWGAQDTENRSLLWSRDFHQGLRGPTETNGAEGSEVSHRGYGLSLCWEVSQNQNLTLSTLQRSEHFSCPHSTDIWERY